MKYSEAIKIVVCGLLMQLPVVADEFQLGEFHFSNGHSIASNELLPVLRFEMPFIYPDYESEINNGILNLSLKNGSSLTSPLVRLSVFPQKDFDVRISRVEVVLITEPDTNDPIRFTHNNKGVNWQTAKAVTTFSSFSQGIASCEKGYELVFSDTMECANDTGYHLFISASDISAITNGRAIGIDYVRFFGPCTDNRVSSINVPEGVQFVGATVASMPIEKVFAIDYENLKEELVLSCTSNTFSVEFLTVDEGEPDMKQLKVVYTPVKTAAYETADIVLTSGSSVSIINVKGWALPENTIVAWNFDEQTLIPVYQTEGSSPSIQLYGASEAVFFDKENNADNRWMLEINKLYTTVNGVSAPETAGIGFTGLDMTSAVRFRMDVQWRNTSPNTARMGAFDTQNTTWLNSVYWKNPRETLGIFSYDGEFTLNGHPLYILSAFDQQVVPHEFRPLKPGSVLSNTTGWAFDNIIISRVQGATDANAIQASDIHIHSENGYVYFRNIDRKVQVSVYAVDGRLIKQKDLFHDDKIPLPDKGTYIIRLSENKQYHIRKIVI